MDTIKLKLEEAEIVGLKIFKTLESRGLIVKGKSEQELNEEVFSLAQELFGIKKHWHKRIVRSGSNTLLPYKENPPNLILQEDDILFFDFGPIIGEWEADLGRTYVIGKDLKKWKLKEDVEKTWYETRIWVLSQKSLRASDLFEFAVEKAKEKNWEFGGEIAGHLIGEFPHEKLEPGNYQLYIHPENHNDIFLPDSQGKTRHWILEIHFVDRKSKIGGFFEQLLM